MSGGERLVWLGHATVVLELDGARIITDPVLSMRVTYLLRQHPAPPPESFRDVDAVLLSHLHFDHLHLPSLRRLGRATPLVVPRGAGGIVARAGFTDVTEVQAGESLEVAGVPVTAVPADHAAERHPRGPSAQPLGFIAGDRRRVYFAGDTSVFAGMADFADAVDIALLPIWGWGPTMGPGHMDPREAAESLVLLRPRVAVPIHWGTFFPVGLSRARGSALVEPPRAFARLAAALAPDVQVEVLQPGQELALG